MNKKEALEFIKFLIFIFNNPSSHFQEDIIQTLSDMQEQSWEADNSLINKLKELKEERWK